MMRFSGRRRRRLPMNAEINITNLVDVAFVLLIIFIITAPILQGGIEVDLPEADAAPLDNSEAVIVSIDADRKLYVGEAEVGSLDELEQVLSVYVGDDMQKAVELKVDRGVPSGDMMVVLGVMNHIGLQNVGVPVIPRVRQ